MKYINKKAFIDSNLWLYAATEEQHEKTILAIQIIEQNNIVVSTQVINEVCVNLLKKHRYTEYEIALFIKQITTFCEICYLTPQTCLVASSLRQHYALSFWDSLIVSSALETKCTILFSEDMQHGLCIQHLQIINPFKK
jgi:predicted nucleic acid-binding protein